MESEDVPVDVIVCETVRDSVCERDPDTDSVGRGVRVGVRESVMSGVTDGVLVALSLVGDGDDVPDGDGDGGDVRDRVGVREWEGVRVGEWEWVRDRDGVDVNVGDCVWV